jgi:hypothetical protein
MAALAVVGAVAITPFATPARGQPVPLPGREEVPSTPTPVPTPPPSRRDGSAAPRRDAIYGTTPLVLPPAAVTFPAEQTDAERQRRNRVAARAGEAMVTIGEIEDHLARSTISVREAFRTPTGRRGVVERLLRLHLLAIEAERRGSEDPAVSHRARRAEERALRDALELEVRRDPGEIPPPSEPVVVPERRFAVILRDDSREDLETWAREIAADRTSFHLALSRANELGEGQETEYGVRETPPEATPPIEPALWAALFEIEHTGTTSPIVALGGGRFARVFHAGVVGGFTDTGPDEGARRMLAGDAAWQALTAQVRSDRVTGLDTTVIEGVAFRMTSDRSRESMEQLSEEVARVQAQLTAASEQGEGGP